MVAIKWAFGACSVTSITIWRAIVPFLAAGSLGPAAQITKGPYLQQVTQASIAIMWQTDVATPSRVDYGMAAIGERSVEDSALRTIHEVRLAGLEAGTAYQYAVGSGGSPLAQGIFRTAPGPEQPVRLVVYGDTRSNPATHAAVAAGIESSRPDIVLHVGDLAQSCSDAALGAEFFAPAHGLLLGTPVFPCMGNHEKGSLAYFDLFSLPNNERWYAFSYGCARVVVLDGTTDFAPGSAEHSWLLAEFASADYAASAWQIVVIHQPPYTASGHSDDRNVQQCLVPLLEQHGVDLVFSGHSHCYERYRNNGIVYIVTGGGGAPLYGLKSDSTPPVREAGAAIYHHVAVDLTPTSARLSARDNNGAEFDAIELSTAGAALAARDDAYTTHQGAPLAVPAPGVLGNDRDPGAAWVAADLVAGVSHGALSLNADGSFVYDPAAGFSGDDSFTYQACDSCGSAAMAKVKLSVAPADSAGAAHGISGQVADGKGNELEGVCIELKGKSGPKQKAQATTDASGHYAFDKLAPGTYIVKPSLKKCVFAPDVAEIALTAAAPSATADFRGALK